MWRLYWQIVFVFFLGSSFVCGSKLPKDGTYLENRLVLLEEYLTTHIEAQDKLREALLQETSRRLSVERQMNASLQDQLTKVDELSQVLQVTEDRVAALDGTLQEEIKLKEEAERKTGAEALVLSKKVQLAESNLHLLTLLNSRLRELEREKGVQNKEILNLHKSTTQLKKSVHGQGQTMRDVKASLEPLVFLTSENKKMVSNLEARITSFNESSEADTVALQDVKNEVLQLSEFLTDMESSMTNLTTSVGEVWHHMAKKKIFKLCPNGYRKVGDDCLQLVEAKLSWSAARLRCEELGILAGGIGDLAVPTSMAHFRTFVAKSEAGSNYLWVGAQRHDDSIWRWISGSSLEEQQVPWDQGEPDDHGNQYHLCVESHGDIKFHDCIANSTLAAVCQLV